MPNSDTQPDNKESLEIATKLAGQEAEAEQKRTNYIDSKTYSLIGFSGIIATLNAGFVTNAFEHIDEASIWTKLIFLASSGITISGLVLAAVLGLIALFPREYENISVKEIQNLMNKEIIKKDPVELKGSIGQTRINTLASDRATNNRKAKFLKACFVSVGIALFFLLVQFGAIVPLYI